MIVKNSGLSLCLAVVLAGFSINGLAAEAKTEKDKKKATTVIVVVPEKETASPWRIKASTVRGTLRLVRIKKGLQNVR